MHSGGYRSKMWELLSFGKQKLWDDIWTLHRAAPHSRLSQHPTHNVALGRHSGEGGNCRRHGPLTRRERQRSFAPAVCLRPVTRCGHIGHALANPRETFALQPGTPSRLPAFPRGKGEHPSGVLRQDLTVRGLPIDAH